MNILITNDDGVGAEGIKILSRALSKKHEVYVIAPDRERSATSHSLTLHSPLRIKEIDNTDFGAQRVWSVTGTPGDCVKIGISTILQEHEKPDIVISGINHGPNLGHDVRYSGTVSAALEGSMLGYPAIAVSLAAIKCTRQDFMYPAQYITAFLDEYKDLDPKIVLNINFPKAEESGIQGTAITQLAQRIFTSEYEKRLDPQGREYYWLAGVPVSDIQDKPTDLDAIRNKKISITPLDYDMTNFDAITKLRKSLDKQLV